MLRGIVGLELRIDRMEGKAKLSQNRSEVDVAAVILGLRGMPSGDTVADEMMRRSSTKEAR
jgi:transcriptional regulator